MCNMATYYMNISDWKFPPALLLEVHLLEVPSHPSGNDLPPSGNNLMTFGKDLLTSHHLEMTFHLLEMTSYLLRSPTTTTASSEK